jgi:ABC-type dipeptide/oligopeptide/nickel transport system permease subunit
MSTTEPGLREQTTLRTVLRVVGVILLVVALVLLGLGLADSSPR